MSVFSVKSVKGFTPVVDRSEKPPLEPLPSLIADAAGLAGLLAESEQLLGVRAAGMLKHLAYMPPVVRLAVNLKFAISELSAATCTETRFGLRVDELAVLREIESASMTETAKRVAYSLFCMEERAKLVQALLSDIKRSKCRAGNSLQAKLLD